MHFRKFILSGLVALATGFCTSAHAKTDEYVFVLYNKGNPYWAAMMDGIKDAAREKGVTATIFQAENTTAGEDQLNQCLTAVERAPKYIIMASANPGVAIQCFKKAAAAGIAVADMDASFPVADAEKAGIHLAFSIGSDNLKVGQEAATYAHGILNRPDAQVLVLEGAPGSVAGGKRVDGFRSTMAALSPQAKITSIGAEWDTLKAMNATNDMLQRQPDLDLVYTANDTMALGAAEAVRNAGKSAQVRIIGVDGIADARKAIEDGKMTATVAQLPYLIGKRSLELAVEDKSKGATETTPTPVLDKATLTENKDPLLQYVR
jgi:ABC-type sugar transport system substrate-binding protein